MEINFTNIKKHFEILITNGMDDNDCNEQINRDIHRALKMRIALNECEEFLKGYRKKKTDFMDILYSSEEYDMDDIFEYYDFLSAVGDFEGEVLVEAYIYYEMYNPLLVDQEIVEEVGDLVEMVKETKNDSQSMLCLLEFLMFLFAPSHENQSKLIYTINRLLNGMNDSAAWGKYWGLDVYNYQFFSEIEDYYTEKVETLLEERNTNNAEDFLAELNLYFPLIESISLVAAFLRENMDFIKCVSLELQEKCDSLNIYAIDWENQEDDSYTKGAKAIYLLNRYLPIIDIMYFLLKKNHYQDKVYAYFKNECNDIRSTIIKYVKRISLAKYDYESATKLVDTYVRSNYESNKEIAYKILLKAIAKSDIEELLNSKRLLSGLYVMNGDDFDEIESTIESICELIWKRIEVQEGRDFYRNEISLMMSRYGVVNDVEFPLTLSTAEYLYNRFMCVEKENKALDYSFVSIMYYTALECLVNELIYTPYTQYISCRDYKNNLSQYFSDSRPLNVNRFFRNRQLKSQIEIGVLGNLFNSVLNVKEFKNYCIHQIGMTTKKLKDLEDFGADLVQAADNRNKAAHGSESLEAEDAKRDKTLVYNKELTNVYCGLVVKCLEMI